MKLTYPLAYSIIRSLDMILIGYVCLYLAEQACKTLHNVDLLFS